MSKGKKFDAAEKHFFEKQQKYEKQIKALNSRLSEQNAIFEDLSAKVKALVAENQQLRLENDKLLEYANLAPADIKAACEKDKKTAEAMSVIGSLYRMGGLSC